MNQKTKILLLIVTVFIALKSINIAPKISDENIYFYMASLVAQGQFPYRDFFFAHMPGQLLMLALPIKLFGFNLFILKLIPLLASVGTAVLLYIKTKNIFAPIFYLFSLTVLATSDHGSGVHEATFFLILSWYLFEIQNPNDKIKKIQPLLGGLALFAGTMTRFYILPAAIGFVFYQIIRQKFQISSKSKIILFLITIFSLFVVANLLFWQLFGEHFLISVWRYHFLKSEGINKIAIVSFFLQNDWLLLVLAGVGIITLFLNKSEIRNTKYEINSFDIRVSNFHSALFALIFQSLFLAFFADIYFLYLVTLIPFISVLAIQGLQIIKQKLLFPFPNLPYLPYFLLSIFFLLNYLNYQSNHAPASVIVNFDKIITDIKGLTGPDDKIFGTFSITPLIAAETNRNITDNQIDTNIKRYLAGFITIDEATKIATESAVFIQTALLDKTGNALSLDPAFVKQDVIRTSCSLFKIYPVPKDYANNAIIVWKCKS